MSTSRLPLVTLCSIVTLYKYSSYLKYGEFSGKRHIRIRSIITRMPTKKKRISKLPFLFAEFKRSNGAQLGQSNVAFYHSHKMSLSMQSSEDIFGWKQLDIYCDKLDCSLWIYWYLLYTMTRFKSMYIVLVINLEGIIVKFWLSTLPNNDNYSN